MRPNLRSLVVFCRYLFTAEDTTKIPRNQSGLPPSHFPNRTAEVIKTLFWILNTFWIAILIAQLN